MCKLVFWTSAIVQFQRSSILDITVFEITLKKSHFTALQSEERFNFRARIKVYIFGAKNQNMYRNWDFFGDFETMWAGTVFFTSFDLQIVFGLFVRHDEKNWKPNRIWYEQN